MKNKTLYRILIVLGIVALVPLGAWLFQLLKSSYTNWNQNLARVESKEPYHTFMIYNLVQKYFSESDFEVIDRGITEKVGSQNESGLYIFIGTTSYLLNDEVDSLLSFVDNGNTAFISSYSQADSLLYALGYQDTYYSYLVKDSVVRGNFVSEKLATLDSFEFKYVVAEESQVYDWKFFPEYETTHLSEVNDFQVDELYQFRGKYQNEYTTSYYDPQDGDGSQFNSSENEAIYTDFIRIKYGKGYFYLHSNPILFSNYYAITEPGKAYTERCLSYLPQGKTVFWDKRSHFYKPANNVNQVQEKSPLSYILSQPSLAWAYYCLVACALIFVIFRGKRTQRIIPILSKKENTSLEFVKAVGHLYFMQKNHQRLSALKARMFFDFVRTKYHIPTHQRSEDFNQKLAQRSGISQERVDSILYDIQIVESSNHVSEWLLRKLHVEIQDFYRDCR